MEQAACQIIKDININEINIFKLLWTQTFRVNTHRLGESPQFFAGRD
jgi:hypothetical protein